MLPKIPYQVEPKTTRQTALRGLNFSDHYEDGSLADSLNLSARRYPYISTKYPREQMEGLTGVSSIYAFDGLWYVKNGGLYRKTGDVTTEVIAPGSPKALSPSEKQFAAMYHKLVIFPDKIYVDLDKIGTGTEAVLPLGAKLENVTGSVTVTSAEEEGAHICTVTLTMPEGESVRNLFQVYDIVKMSGWTNLKNNRYKQIIEIPEGTNDTFIVQDETMEEESGATVTIEREVPNLDFICEKNNRLFGASNDSRTIYISARDDPRNFMSDNDAGGFAVDVATEGQFTGCASMSNSVVFFKEHSITKILGDYASEFTLNNYEMEGVKKDCHKSIRKINETVLYLGSNGVYSYNGGNSSLISHIFGEKRLKNGVAGTDGMNYYLSAKDGENTLFLSYSLQTGLWLREDDTEAKDFALVGETLYVLDDEGKVWKENGEEGAILFSMTFKPFFETVSGAYKSSAILFANKRYAKIYLRTEMAKGAYCRIEVRLDGGVWREVGKIVGKGGLTVTPLPIGRCDKYELRLHGKGPFTLLNLEREFRVGSAR